MINKKILILVLILPLFLSGCVFIPDIPPCDPPDNGDDEMVYLIVKLTATDSGNTALNPENALDSDDSYATAQNPANRTLYRVDGDHDGSELGGITKVEACAEVNGNVADCELRGGYLGVGSAGTDIPVTGSDVVNYYNITSVKTWTWADFANSSLFVYIYNPWIGQVYCDQLFIRVTYTGIKTNEFNRIAGSEFP